MPAEDDSSLLANICVGCEWLATELSSSNKCQLLILDCRSSMDFSDCHIRDAVNFSIPTIMLRRLAAGKIDLASTVKCTDLRKQIVDAYKHSAFVLYGDERLDNRKHTSSVSDTMVVLAKRLLKDGCKVHCLNENFDTFQQSYPEWCESFLERCARANDDMTGFIGDTDTLMGLRSLHITPSLVPNSRPSRRQHQLLSMLSTSPESSGGSDIDSLSDVDSSSSILGFDEDRDFPVEILPDLFLGNAANSEDLEWLKKHRIEYILNVTSDLPNTFEEQGNIKYMQIPISDHIGQNLASFFPQAIEFIDNGRAQKKGVLVHCLAGISRSVTVMLAYLMAHRQLTLNEAYNMVLKRKANIDPNFHFMQQLHSFEKQMLDARTQPKQSANSTGSSASSYLSPLSTTVQSPDSGIEFDRWTPGTGG
ncbi:Protein-tyrosine phosphatase-like,Rhodanese-like domain,Tyrosine specific protein phosphatases domain,Dual [Cinara cedri]|uniref:protein-tyrosine-phosphatase n=1 Tax=Cinara cedri TaxID=506608 RepID=A0A5E4M3L1_9HEMI|nr:Protein-tyrosine phosphatase-like,Rhodanese-like domain,Tyrosine specific protein phosphatases domain,Dual [Cinara cedri]